MKGALRPGVAEVGKPVTVEIELSEVLETPHPTYGRSKPIDDGDLRLIISEIPEMPKNLPFQASSKNHSRAVDPTNTIRKCLACAPSVHIPGLSPPTGTCQWGQWICWM